MAVLDTLVGLSVYVWNVFTSVSGGCKEVSWGWFEIWSRLIIVNYLNWLEKRCRPHGDVKSGHYNRTADLAGCSAAHGVAWQTNKQVTAYLWQAHMWMLCKEALALSHPHASYIRRQTYGRKCVRKSKTVSDKRVIERPSLCAGDYVMTTAGEAHWLSLYPFPVLPCRIFTPASSNKK